MLNNPFGKVFEFNKKTKELSLLADGMYFANGIAFQMYNGQETVLVSETNRFRLTRIYVSGKNRGNK
jgi:sugar lactone lactonase YvrE